MKSNILIPLLSILMLTSCNGWLDVKPKSFVEEADLFSHEVGFKEALTACYQLAAGTNLYGRTLTYDFTDKLAQRYVWRGTSATGPFPYQNPNFYHFKSASNERIINSIWRDMYNVIANINNLLSWTEQNRHVLITPGYYEIIKGEALALRSYLYFDLLRMFGPVYAVNPTERSIVYRTELNRDFRDLEPANTILDYIIADLLEAEKLLKDTDPLNFDYSQWFSPEMGDPFLNYRFKRMNHIAVKALLARTYLYQGNVERARDYASDVINSERFSLATGNLNGGILPTEVIFSFHMNMIIDDRVTNNLVSTRSWVIEDVEFFANLFNTAEDGDNDFRVRLDAGFDLHDGRIYVMRKFGQTRIQNTPMEGTMPMIRLAEMYYILSETSPTLDEAVQWLNTVRQLRGLAPLAQFENETVKMHHIELEYRKEFYGEGQLWYFYKRTNANAHQFFNMTNIIPEWEHQNYVFPVPDNEFIFGGVTQ